MTDNRGSNSIPTAKEPNRLENPNYKSEPKKKSRKKKYKQAYKKRIEK